MGKKGIRSWQPPQLTTKAKIGIGLVVLVFGGALVALIVTSSLSRQLALQASGNSAEDFAKKDAATRQKDALTNSAQAIESGDSDKANDIYEEALKAETDPTKKVELAINQSKALNMGGKYEEALKVAKNAESFSDDKYLISDWLGRLYAIGKRYGEAATYYAKAGSLADSPTNKGGYTKKYYDDKVVAMKAQAAKQ